jgi:hypothetical protein
MSKTVRTRVKTKKAGSVREAGAVNLGEAGSAGEEAAEAGLVEEAEEAAD